MQNVTFLNTSCWISFKLHILYLLMFLLNNITLSSLILVVLKFINFRCMKVKDRGARAQANSLQSRALICKRNPSSEIVN